MHAISVAVYVFVVWRWLSCGSPQASRREFRAHLDEVITLKSRYSTLDQVNPLLATSSYLHAGVPQNTTHATCITAPAHRQRQRGRKLDTLVHIRLHLKFSMDIFHWSMLNVFCAATTTNHQRHRGFRQAVVWSKESHFFHFGSLGHIIHWQTFTSAGVNNIWHLYQKVFVLRTKSFMSSSLSWFFLSHLEHGEAACVFFFQSWCGGLVDLCATTSAAQHHFACSLPPSSELHQNSFSLVHRASDHLLLCLVSFCSCRERVCIWVCVPNMDSTVQKY